MWYVTGYTPPGQPSDRWYMLNDELPGRYKAGVGFGRRHGGKDCGQAHDETCRLADELNGMAAPSAPVPARKKAAHAPPKLPGF